MKSTWNGRIVSETANSALHCWLVLHPVDTLTPQLQKNLARILGIDEIDVRVKVHTGGFITLTENNDAGHLHRESDNLKQIGINSSVFEGTQYYNVPVLSMAHSGSFKNGVFTFMASNDVPLAEISGADRLLIVKARLDIDYLTRSTKLRPPMRVGGEVLLGLRAIPKTTQTTETTGNTKISVIDIYNLSKQTCVRLMESKFNFNNVLEGKVTYSFIASAKLLIDKFTSLGIDYTIDECFNKSVLPLPKEVLTKETMDSRIYSSINSKVTSNDIERFSGYSRFRYIIETTKT